ncbi:MAG: hypothetical protein U0232_19395 [Thermomicrobiales bacterium]
MRAAICGAPCATSTLIVTAWSAHTFGGLIAVLLTLLTLTISLLLFAFLLLYTATPYPLTPTIHPTPDPAT